MSLADSLIQEAWTDAVGPSVRLYPDEVPESAQASFPNAGYVFTDCRDESPLSDSTLEIETYVVSIAHTNRRVARSLARDFAGAVERLDHETLVEASAKLAETTLVKTRAGSERFYEISVTVSIMLWNQE